MALLEETNYTTHGSKTKYCLKTYLSKVLEKDNRARPPHDANTNIKHGTMHQQTSISKHLVLLNKLSQVPQDKKHSQE